MLGFTSLFFIINSISVALLDLQVKIILICPILSLGSLPRLIHSLKQAILAPLVTILLIRYRLKVAGSE